MFPWGSAPAKRLKTIGLKVLVLEHDIRKKKDINSFVSFLMMTFQLCFGELDVNLIWKMDP